MKKGKAAYKRVKMVPGWKLEQHRATGTYILSIPQSIDTKEAKKKLKTLPGTESFIVSEIFEGNEIYFRCDLSIQSLAKELYPMFGLEEVVRTRKKYTKKKRRVLQYKDGVLVNVWDYVFAAAEAGYNQGQISRCCTGKIDKYLGYTWKYETN